jgi:hypothetical protein
VCVCAAMQLQLLKHCFVLPVERKRAVGGGRRYQETMTQCHVRRIGFVVVAKGEQEGMFISTVSSFSSLIYTRNKEG